MKAITTVPPSPATAPLRLLSVNLVLEDCFVSNIPAYLCLSECPSQRITCSFTVVINVHLGVVSCLQDALVPPEKNLFAAFPISAGSVGSSAWNPMLVFEATNPLCESVKSSKKRCGYPPTVARAIFPAFVFPLSGFPTPTTRGQKAMACCHCEVKHIGTLLNRHPNFFSF